MWAHEPRAGEPLQSDWLKALSAFDPGVPGSLLRFDALCERDLACDAFECSAKLARDVDLYRTTRYFDTGRYPEERIHAVDALLTRVAEELGIDIGVLSPALLGSEARKNRPLQTVLGVDAGGSEVRLKYYWVLRAHSEELMRRLFDELGVSVPDRVNLDQVYICGLDFTTRGLHDIKLYFALDPVRVPRVVRNLGQVAELYSDAKLLNFQHCLLRPGKRQLFFHARRADTVQRALARLTTPRAGELIEHMDRLNGMMPRGKMEPWIVAFPYRDGVLDLDACNVYFHPTISPSSR